MFQFETIPGSKKAKGFLIIISGNYFSKFHIGSLFPFAFLPERVIKLKNGGIM